MIGKAKQQAAAGDPRAQLLDAQKRIVEQVGILQDLRLAEEAAAQSVVAAEGILASCPSLYASPLWAGVDAVQRNWHNKRRDLVAGGPEPLTREEEAVIECRSGVLRAEEMLGKYQGMLGAAPGGDTTSRKELQVITLRWAEELKRSRVRLAEALRSLPHMTQAQRREVQELTEQGAERVKVELSV